ncbi:hypothetical protein D3C83_129020 [compost metagenome]
MHGEGVGVGDRTFDLVDTFGHEANGSDHRWQIHVDHIDYGLAHVQGFKHGQLLGILIHQFGEAIHDVHAIPRRHARPDT